MAMAAAARSPVLRSGILRATAATAPKRSLATAAHHDDAYEAQKWEKITYLGIATCTVLSFYNLSKGHSHHDEPPAYPYMHIRNKEFPWGPDGLFEKKEHHH